jgi:hypothetical protein
MKNTPKKTAKCCRVHHKKECCDKHHRHHEFFDKFLRNLAPGSVMPIDIIDVMLINIVDIFSKDKIKCPSGDKGPKEPNGDKGVDEPIIKEFCNKSRFNERLYKVLDSIFGVVVSKSKFDFSNVDLDYRPCPELDKSAFVFAFEVSCTVKEYDKESGIPILKRGITTIYIYPDPIKTVNEFDKEFSNFKFFKLPLKSYKKTCDKKEKKATKAKKTQKPSKTEKTENATINMETLAGANLNFLNYREKPIFKEEELMYLLIGDSSYKISKDALDVKYISFDTKNQRYVYNISLIDKKNEMHYLILNIYKKRLSKDLIIKKFDKFVAKVDTFLKK